MINSFKDSLEVIVGPYRVSNAHHRNTARGIYSHYSKNITQYKPQQHQVLAEA